MELGRHGDLHERHAPPPFRVPLEEALEGEQAVGDPLGVVEPVDAEQDDVGTEGGPETARMRPHGGVLRLLLQARRLDAHRKRHHMHVAPRQAYARTFLVRRQVQEVAHAIEEVLRVPVGLQPDQVGAEHPREQLGPPRADAEHGRRRERQVPEETDVHGHAGGAQETGHQAQVEVVDPDEVAGGGLRPHRGREALVRLLICRPERGLEAAPVREHVTQWPEDLVGEARVEGGGVALLQADGADRIRESRVRRRELPVGRPRGPGHPHSAVLSHGVVQGVGKAAGGASRSPAGGSAAHLDGGGVRQNEKPARRTHVGRDSTCIRCARAVPRRCRSSAAGSATRCSRSARVPDRPRRRTRARRGSAPVRRASSA